VGRKLPFLSVTLQRGDPFDSNIIPGELGWSVTCWRRVAGSISVISEMFSKLFSVAQGRGLGNRLACGQGNAFLPESSTAAFYFLGSRSELPLLCGHEAVKKSEKCDEFRFSV